MESEEKFYFPIARSHLQQAYNRPAPFSSFVLPHSGDNATVHLNFSVGI